MTLPALTALFAAAVLAQPAPGRNQQKPAVDPASLSPEARAAYEADPAAFQREHGADLETLRRWTQDPSLGQKECVEAKKEPRSCMEQRVQSLSQVATPQALAVIDAYVRLMPRGVSAAVPERPGQGSAPTPGPAATPALSFGAPGAPASPSRASEFRPGPNTVTFNAVPSLSAAPAQPAAPPSFWEEQYNLYLCFYFPSKCPTR